MAKKNKEKKSEDNGENDEVKKPKKGILGLIFPPLIFAIAAAATVYFLPGSNTPAQPEGVHAETAAHEPTASWTPRKADYVVSLDPLMVSIRDEHKILKIGLALETFSDDVDPSDPRLRDSFTTYLRAISVEQVENAGFHITLKEQLLRRARLVLGDDVVQNVLVTDFLIT